MDIRYYIYFTGLFIISFLRYITLIDYPWYVLTAIPFMFANLFWCQYVFRNSPSPSLFIRVWEGTVFMIFIPETIAYIWY